MKVQNNWLDFAYEPVWLLCSSLLCDILFILNQYGS